MFSQLPEPQVDPYFDQSEESPEEDEVDLEPFEHLTDADLDDILEELEVIINP